jgi:hypothetical protein
MTAFWANTRYVGWSAAGLLVIATLLTWITVSGPFIGSMSVTGIKTDDGKVALGLAVVLGGVALFANRMWLGIGGVVAVAYYGYELVHVSSFDLVDETGSKFEQSLEKAFNVTAGFGIYLGLLTGLALVGWGLVLPYVQKRKAAEAVTDPAPDTASR